MNCLPSLCIVSMTKFSPSTESFVLYFIVCVERGVKKSLLKMSTGMVLFERLADRTSYSELLFGKGEAYHYDF